MNKYVIIVAGGKGLRMGGSLPKQFIPIEGKPILMHTLETFHRWDKEAKLILVLPADHQPYWQMLCRELNCRIPHNIISGGETRYHSVRNGLQLIQEQLKDTDAETDTLIGVHDGVRPFVAPSVLTACFQEAQKTGAAIPTLPMIESLRERFDDGSSRPVDRSRYVTVQTPQVFQATLLRHAYEQPYTSLFTDDASVVEKMGHSISMVEGNRENIKITTPIDLEIAKALLQERSLL